MMKWNYYKKNKKYFASTAIVAIAATIQTN